LQLVSKFEIRCIYGEVVGLVRLSLSGSRGGYQGGTTPPWPASARGCSSPLKEDSLPPDPERHSRQGGDDPLAVQEPRGPCGDTEEDGCDCDEEPFHPPAHPVTLTREP